jgi:hypothetical protein
LLEHARTLFTPDEYERIRRALAARLREIREAHRRAVEGLEDAEWAKWYARELLADLTAVLPGRWTVEAVAAELWRAEAEREAQRPHMDPATYYAEWLAIRAERGEVP